MAGLRLRLRIGRRPYKAPRRGFQVRGASRSPRGARLFETLCRSVCHSKRSSNACAPSDHSLRRPDQNSLEAFYKRFSGPERAQVSDRRGADARRDATSGQFVCFDALGPALWMKRSEEHTSELQSLAYLVCRLLLEKKKNKLTTYQHTKKNTYNSAS